MVRKKYGSGRLAAGRREMEGHPRALPWIFIIILLLFCGGCMKMGKDYTRPDTAYTIPENWMSQSAAADYHRETEASWRWWRIFNNPDLNRFVRRVINNNHDIKKATTSILEAEAELGITHADRLPTVNLSFEAKRAQKTQTATLPGISRTTDNYAVSLPAAFEIDLWGRLARTEEAARAKLLAATNARATVINTVIAESVTLYFRDDATERRHAVARQHLANRRKHARLITNRYREGLVSADALNQAEMAVNQAEIAVLNLERERNNIRQQLCVLAGQYPGKSNITWDPADDATAPPSPVTMLKPVRAGIPADLLKNRPDIRSAEASLKALNASIGAAKAARFPTISLTGAYGYTNNELSDLLTPESELWNIASGITRPVFDAGRLKALHEASKARYENGLQEYAQTVLKAFAEVENGLFNRKSHLKSRERQINTLRAAQRAYENAQRRYEGGIATLNDVLTREQTLLDVRENLVLTELSIITNRVTLERALGGIFTPAATAADATKSPKQEE
ncbi:MAG: TolC family protein [Thermodesulfobacteriota bacterium]|nr:TolC family protein [Thermodesulfobacteriota bacterium]